MKLKNEVCFLKLKAYNDKKEMCDFGKLEHYVNKIMQNGLYNLLISISLHNFTVKQLALISPYLFNVCDDLDYNIQIQTLD
jgi:hypothetical protein